MLGTNIVEHIVATGLRALSGGRPKDLRHIIGCSPRTVYLAVNIFIDAVNSASELDIHLPQTEEGWPIINEGWRHKITYEIITGCVGSLDGFFSMHKLTYQKRGIKPDIILLRSL
jgi:hypothetical protein